MKRPASRAAGRQVPGTYVFCLFAAPRPPRLTGVPAGPRGLGSVRVLAVGDGLWAAVADAPADRFSEAAIRTVLLSVEKVSTAALAHEAVVRFFFRRRAVIPLKMFTIYASDERASGDLRPRAAHFSRLLGRLEGRQEWGVALDPAAPPSAATHRPPSSGREYLQTRGRAIASAARRSSAHAAETMMRALSPGTADRRLDAREPTPGGPAVTAAFLVERGRLAAWRTRTARLRARLEGDGWSLRLTGPWPPYSFIGAPDEE